MHAFRTYMQSTEQRFYIKSTNEVGQWQHLDNNINSQISANSLFRLVRIWGKSRVISDCL